MRNSEDQSKRSRKRWGNRTRADRFWDKVNKTEGCWWWIGAGAKHKGRRYGSAYDPDGRFDGAHRVCWKIARGPIPPGMQVLHTCDNKLCVRPDHLFLGTQSDNMKDMVNKGRHAQSHKTDQRGEKNNGAKHNQDTIEKAKSMLLNGHRQCDVMRATGLTRSNVWCIAHGKSWQ